MKVIHRISLWSYQPNTREAETALEEILAACKHTEPIDQILDTLWAQNGLTPEEWDELLVREKDHIIARFGSD